jgi:hypothetical protein
MNFIQEQYRSLAAVPESLAGGFEDGANFLDADGSGIDLLEMALGICGDELRQSRFAGARRAIEDHAGQPIGFEHSTKEFAGAQEMLLSDKFFERPRAHAYGQWRRAIEVLLPGFVK